jgi:hypothetical protein
MFPHTITIWNKIASNHTGGFTYHRTVVSGVRYEITSAKTSTKEGSSNTSSINIYVFLNKINNDSKYIDPELFKEMSLKDNYFTFDNDTYVGVGDIDNKMPSGKHFLLDEIKPVYALENEIHHFEIKGS